MKRYRTNQLTVDPMTRAMSMLLAIVSRVSTYCLVVTHSVVKFIVKVKLIEKIAKSHVGRVIVAKVISQ